MEPPPSPPAGSGNRVIEPPPLDLQFMQARATKLSPLSVQTPKVAVLEGGDLLPSGKYFDDIGAAAFGSEDPLAVGDAEISDGYSAQQIFASPGSRGYTFDDLIVLPGSIDFGVDDVDLSTRITKRISLSSPVKEKRSLLPFRRLRPTPCYFSTFPVLSYHTLEQTNGLQSLPALQFCSSPMDTVTEEAMATSIALQGGLGFVHCHCSIREQANFVRAVKSFQNGFIPQPACMRGDMPLSALDQLSKDKNISGVPITEDGQIGSRLVGFVEGKDVDFEEDRTKPISSVMAPLGEVTTAQAPCTLEAASRVLKAAKANYLCVVDAAGNLKALTTRTDLIKNRDYPQAVKSAMSPKRRSAGGGNSNGNGNGGASDEGLDRLACGAAIELPSQKAPPEYEPHSPKGGGEKSSGGAAEADADADAGADADVGAAAGAGGGGELEEYQERATALVEAGVDVVVVDSRHGDTEAQISAVKWLKAAFPAVEVVGGNVATYSQTKRLLDAGVDGLRVGMGVGSIATSQQVKACGRAQLSAIYHSAKLARQYGVPVIADGGVASTGGAIKALSMGASVVMMGSMLAGVDESPGEYFFQDGMRLKKVDP